MILDKKNIKNQEQNSTKNRLKQVFVIFILGYLVLVAKLFDYVSFADNSIKSSSYVKADNLVFRIRVSESDNSGEENSQES